MSSDQDQQGVTITVPAAAEGGEADPFVGMLRDDACQISVADGEVICSAGDAPDSWWYVLDGVADVSCDGLYLATVGPGETIGEISMLDGRPRSATVIAKSAMRTTAEERTRDRTLIRRPRWIEPP